MSPCGKKWHISIYEALHELRKIKRSPNAKRAHSLSVYECVRSEVNGLLGLSRKGVTTKYSTANNVLTV